MLENLEKLSVLPGVSGREDAVRSYIISQIKELADGITVDSSGSIIALKRGARETEHRVMVTAHMDEVGLIITDVDGDGLLKFAAVGRIDQRVLCGRTVLVGEAKIPGVIGICPIHLIDRADMAKCPEAEDLCIDIGASSKEEAEAVVTPGDVCVFDTVFEQIGEGRLKGRALSGRAGCAVLIELMKQEYLTDVWFVFTAKGETGHVGAGCAAFTVHPEYAVVIDGATAADIAGVDGNMQVCRLGSGAAVAFMDKRTIYDRELVTSLLELGREKGVSVQLRQAVTDSNDSKAIQSACGGVRTAAICIPCRYMRAPASIMAVEDLTAVQELAFELVTSLCI